MSDVIRGLVIRANFLGIDFSARKLFSFDFFTNHESRITRELFAWVLD
jgi:hypothetical protein